MAKSWNGVAQVPSIAVIGRGLTGIAAAAALLERIRTPFSLLLIDPAPTFGGGLAYGEARAGEILNVRARELSLSVHAPGEFASWLKSRTADVPLGVDVGALFAPRALFGAYVEERFRARAASRDDVEWRAIDARAAAIRAMGPGRYEVDCAGAGTFYADIVILATGYGARLRRMRFGLNPFAPISPAALGGAARIVLVGSGLTMVDVLFWLRRQGYSGEIAIISRRGLLPSAQSSAEAIAPQPPPAALAGGGLAAMVRRVRADCRSETARGRDWRGVIGAMRPYTNELWRSLSDVERRRFERHLRPYWDIHRHRLPLEQHRRLVCELDGEKTTLRAGDVLSVDGGLAESEGPAQVRVRWRGRREPVLLEADFVFDCSGHRPDLAAPLVRSLIDAGLAEFDALGLGLAVEPDGALFSRDSSHRGALFALGPLGAGSLLEATAAPEIVAQAAMCAQRAEAALGARRGCIARSVDDAAEQRAQFGRQAAEREF